MKNKVLRRLLIAAGTLAVLFVIAVVRFIVEKPTPPAGWHEYVLLGDRCTVWMPGTPDKKHKITPDNNPADPHTTHLMSSQHIKDGRSYSVLYLFFTPYKRLRGSAAQRFADYEQTLFSKTQVKLRERDITLQGCPGKEYWVRMADKPFTAVNRTYMLDESIYTVLYTFPNTDPNVQEIPEDGETFFDSFTFRQSADKQPAD
jgi:hypothetical protein